MRTSRWSMTSKDSLCLTKSITLFCRLLLWMGLSGLVPCVNAQSSLSQEELEILHLIYRDSSRPSTIYFPHHYRFGLSWQGYSFLIMAKEKAAVYILLPGSHEVYMVSYASPKLSLVRVDSSQNAGDNFNCMAMVYRDTLYEYGGYGFWSNRNFFTRFVPVTGEWEFVQGGNGLENTLVMSYLDEKNHSFYTLGSFEQNSFRDFNPTFHDSVYRFDFNAKRWSVMGSIIPDFLRNYRQEIQGLTWSTPFGLGIVLPNNQFYIADFKNNRLLRFRKSVEDSIIALRSSGSRQITNGQSLWMYSRDSLFYFTGNGHVYAMTKMKLDESMLDPGSGRVLFKPDENIKEPFAAFAVSTNKWIYPLIISVLTFTILAMSFNRRPQKQVVALPSTLEDPEVVLSVSPSIFFEKLNEVEKQLVKELIHFSLQDKKMQVTVINKILGVSGKDAEVQKTRRSNTITGINNLFTECLHTPGVLIDKERDPFDKRAWLYFIEEEKAHLLLPSFNSHR